MLALFSDLVPFATVSTLLNDGAIGANSTTAVASQATALQIDAGAPLASLTNNGSIGATITGAMSADGLEFDPGLRNPVRSGRRRRAALFFLGLARGDMPMTVIPAAGGPGGCRGVDPGGGRS